MAEGTQQREREVGRANTRAYSWLAWSLAGLSGAMFLASIPLCILARSAHVPAGWDADLSLGSLVGGGLFLVFPLVGALIASGRPENPIGWLCLTIGLLWTLSGMLEYYSVYGIARPSSLPFPLGLVALNLWLWVPSIGLLGTYLILLFPDGRLPSRRWRPLAWLSGAVIALLCIGITLTPEPLGPPGLRNPFAPEEVSWVPWVTSAAYAVLPLLPLCILASALSLVLRYRRSRGEERQQIKWMAFAASLVGLLYLIAMVASLIAPSDDWSTAGPMWWLNLLTFVTLLSFTTIPVAVGFAVMRYRLYDIDLIINRALVYGLLSVLLAATYFGGAVSLQYAFRTLAGQGSTLAIVASTLAIAALFTPLRRRVQALVDRRFYRTKYDAAKTLAAFSARLRDETDVDVLRNDVVGVARSTVQPAHASLWLRPDPGPGARSAGLSKFGYDEEEG